MSRRRLDPATQLTRQHGRVVRFDRTERLVHWSFSLLFLTLLATGLALWIPSLSVAVGNREVLREVHIVAGLLLVPVPLAVALAGNRAGVRRDLRAITRFDDDDVAFLLRRPSRPGRFNAGQKLNSLWTALATVLFLASGIVQWQWTRFSPTWRTGASELHDLLTILAIPIVLGHVYLSALHRTTRASLGGMVVGSVPEGWSSDHHPRAADEPSGHPVGRRVVLGGVGAGVLSLMSGGRLLPRIELPTSSGGWRIYNVAGHVPSPAGFELVVDGLVQRRVRLTLAELLDLEHEEQVSDFECVTGWKVDDVRWGGVRLDTLLALAGIQGGATHVTFGSRDGVYTDSLALADATAPDTMVATAMDGRPLPRRHGGPARLVVPSMYGYKSVKWLGSLHLTDREHVGYWERRGYARDARIDTSGERAVYRGGRRAVPAVGVTVLVPDGWTAAALPAGGAAYRGREPGGRVEVSIIAAPTTVRADRELTQSMLAGLERAGLSDVRYGALRAGDLTADVLQADDGSGQRFLFAFFPDGRRVLQVQGQAPGERWSRYGPLFEQLAASIRPT